MRTPPTLRGSRREVAIPFVGRYPRDLFDFSEGVIRWTNQAVSYAAILITDRYPPFRLGP